MTMAERPIPAPELNPEILAYFEAAAEGRLLVKACRACDQAFHYPRAICPYCHSSDTEWREASGRGTIYSFSVLRRAPIPYAVASVALAEGPQMITNIVDCDLDGLHCDMPVRVVFKPSEGGPPVPMFTPEGDAA
jgi:uncharacterized OB-fold protein